MYDFPISKAYQLMDELNKTAGFSLKGLGDLIRKSPQKMKSLIGRLKGQASKVAEQTAESPGVLDALKSKMKDIKEGMFSWEEPFMSELIKHRVPGFDARSLSDLGTDQIGRALRELEHSNRGALSAIADLSVRNAIPLKDATEFYVRKGMPGSKQLVESLNKYTDLAEARVGADWLISRGLSKTPTPEHSKQIYNTLMESGSLHDVEGMLGDFPQLSVAKARASGIARKLLPVGLGAAGVVGLQKLINKKFPEGMNFKPPSLIKSEVPE